MPRCNTVHCFNCVRCHIKTLVVDWPHFLPARWQQDWSHCVQSWKTEAYSIVSTFSCQELGVSPIGMSRVWPCVLYSVCAVWVVRTFWHDQWLSFLCFHFSWPQYRVSQEFRSLLDRSVPGQIITFSIFRRATIWLMKSCQTQRISFLSCFWVYQRSNNCSRILFIGFIW